MSETSILLPDGFEPSRRRFLSNTGKATLSAAAVALIMGNQALAQSVALPVFDPRRGLVMDDPTVVIQAALTGQGVALATLALVSGDLADGRLVKPFDLKLETEFAYYIVYPPDALAQVKVRAFRDFLLAEAAEESEQTSV